MEQAVSSWTLDKKLSLSNLFSTIALIVGLFQWGNHIDRRITTLEAESQHNKEQSEMLYKRLDRIEDKLDRLIEKNQ